MLKATPHNLKKMETIFKESKFKVRYGKGNFHAGYCILDDTRQVIINKFYPPEMKISILIDLVGQLHIEPNLLSDPSLKLYQKLTGKKIEDLEESETDKIAKANKEPKTDEKADGETESSAKGLDKDSSKDSSKDSAEDLNESKLVNPSEELANGPVETDENKSAEGAIEEEVEVEVIK